MASSTTIPAGQPPRAGHWVKGPGKRFFEVVERHMGRLPLCAEDLGAIDDEVVALRDGAGLPGMRILHYAFGSGAGNPHLPHNHPEGCIAYPGNHDNDTSLGWWRTLDARARVAVVTSALDNLGKGAAGSATQAMNAVLGLPETTGLDLLGG